MACVCGRNTLRVDRVGDTGGQVWFKCTACPLQGGPLEFLAAASGRTPDETVVELERAGWLDARVKTPVRSAPERAFRNSLFDDPASLSENRHGLLEALECYADLPEEQWKPFRGTVGCISSSALAEAYGIEPARKSLLGVLPFQRSPGAVCGAAIVHRGDRATEYRSTDNAADAGVYGLENVTNGGIILGCPLEAARILVRSARFLPRPPAIGAVWPGTKRRRTGPAAWEHIDRKRTALAIDADSVAVSLWFAQQTGLPVVTPQPGKLIEETARYAGAGYPASLVRIAKPWPEWLKRTLAAMRPDAIRTMVREFEIYGGLVQSLAAGLGEVDRPAAERLLDMADGPPPARTLRIGSATYAEERDEWHRLGTSGPRRLSNFILRITAFSPADGDKPPVYGLRLRCRGAAVDGVFSGRGDQLGKWIRDRVPHADHACPAPLLLSLAAGFSDQPS